MEMVPQLATFGIWELLVILLIVVVIFGASRLPQLGDALGRSIRNFKSSMKGEAREVQGEARRIEEGSRPAELPPGQAPASIDEARVKSTLERK